MSTRSHDKTVETADNPVYDVLFCFFFFLVIFCYFFVNRFLCVFKRVSTQQYQVGTECAAGFFFLRDHRRTSPFSNLFKILLDFGTELLLFPNCFISECSVFFNFFLYFIFAVFKAEIPIFHTTPHDTHVFSNPVQYCGFIPSSLSTKYTLATELLHVC